MPAVLPPAELARRPAAPAVPGYVLQELLGRGGSGEVWRAVPRGGGAAVAVKVLVDGDPERQAREAALLARVDHPHLVRLHEVVHQPRRGGSVRVALVLDLLEGGSLASLLARRGRLRPGEVVTAVAPVAAALAVAHERGVVHGDLSPGNIVFTAEGRPVLTDLGVARVLGEEAAGGVTPAYVDPTVARGGAPGPASDVFGVAAAAFHSLTGIPPWNAATPADTLRVAADGRLPDLTELAPGAPPALLGVIRRGLEADPHARGTAAEFALDLRAACRPEPVRLPAPGVPEAELDRTGRGPRTELTHQVPRGGRDPGQQAGERRDAPSWSGALVSRVQAASAAAPARIRRGLRTVGRPFGLLALCGALVLGVLWAGSAWGRGASSGGGRGGEAAAAGQGGGRPTFPAAGPAPGDDVRAERTTPPPATAEEWAAVVQALYRKRAEAFTGGSSALLAAVYTPDSPQLAADRAAVDALVAEGRVLRGLRPTVVTVSSADASAQRVELRLVDGWSGYEVVPRADPEGTALVRASGRSPAPVRMQLHRTGDGWRIQSVERDR